MAPPERPAHFTSTSFLPPPPTVLSSHACLECEPRVSAEMSTDEEYVTDDEESNEESNEDKDEDDIVIAMQTDAYDETADDQDYEDNEIGIRRGRDPTPQLRFGPPIGKQRSSHPVHASASTAGVSSVAKSTVTTQSDDHMDISILEPPAFEPPANGSSRATGGLTRGQAFGNAPNFGDMDVSNAPVDQFLPGGSVNLTIVTEPPRSMIVEDTSSILQVSTLCHPTMGPVLKHIARAYSPLQSKSIIFIYDY